MLLKNIENQVLLIKKTKLIAYCVVYRSVLFRNQDEFAYFFPIRTFVARFRAGRGLPLPLLAVPVALADLRVGAGLRGAGVGG